VSPTQERIGSARRGTIRVVSRAKQRTLQELEPWLQEVRALGIDGLVEKANGAFYKRRVGILHFHEDGDGVYADVKVDGEWQRVQINGVQGKRAVLKMLRTAYVTRASRRSSGQ